MKCSVEKCDSKIYAKELCNRHYLQVRKHGKVITTNKDKRPAAIEDGYALIPLGVGGKQGYAKIDIEDSWIDKYMWSKHHSGYAYAQIDGEVIAMHRLLTDKPVGKFVDHANHDRLDNRRINLRVCSNTENRRNSHKSKRNSTGYKGVVKIGNKFTAQLGYLGKKLYLGMYNTPEEAGRAYDIKAKQLHGSFAKLNFETKGDK